MPGRRAPPLALQHMAVPAGTLPDGTPYFAPLGEIVHDGEERIQCHLCGRFLRKVGGTHLRVVHGWTIEQYRDAFELPAHVPTCSRELSDHWRRSASSRIGRNGFAAPPPDPARPGKRAPSWRSLAQVRPDLVRELHPTRNGDLQSSALAAGSHQRVWWRCVDCGHEWEASPTNRVGRGSGCPACAVRSRSRARRVVPVERSLTVLRPDLAEEWPPSRNRPTEPQSTGVGSNMKVWWKCRACGHEWSARVSSRASGAGCPECGPARPQTRPNAGGA